MLIKIHTKTIRQLDPGLMVYEVELQNDRGVWRETYGSKSEVVTFLRGVEASYNLVTGSFLRLPLIPNHSDEATDAYTKDQE